MHSCVSFVSFKNPSELQSILLVSRYVKIMSVVSLKNLDQLLSTAFVVVLVKVRSIKNMPIGF